MQDYTKLSKQELLERRRELKYQAETQFNRFSKLKGKDKILMKYQPYQIFKEMSRASKSGARALKVSNKDTRNRVLEDIYTLENILSKETATVTGARRVFKKQVKNQARKIKAAQKMASKRSAAAGDAPTPVMNMPEIEKIISSNNYFKFLHSREFKELSKVNKKASEEAIEFYVKMAEYGLDKILKKFNEFLNSDKPLTKEMFDENPFI